MDCDSIGVEDVGVRRSKYNAVKTVVDGITFDSKLEAKRYGELKLLERAGEISKLRMHTLWPLVTPNKLWKSGQDVGGAYGTVGHYESDFDYNDRNGNFIVEDCKGVRTDLYRWKRKHFVLQNGMQITEITK